MIVLTILISIVSSIALVTEKDDTTLYMSLLVALLLLWLYCGTYYEIREEYLFWKKWTLCWIKKFDSIMKLTKC